MYAVGNEEHDGYHYLHENRQLHDAGCGGDGEEREKEADVPPGRRPIYHELRPVAPAAPEAERGGPDDEHRERGEQERRPEDRPDADLTRAPPRAFTRDGGAYEGDHRDHGLRQGGANRRQHAPDIPLPEV